MSDALRRTPLFALHKEAGAKFVSFGGWEMPVQYSGVIKEHQTVRSAVGLFDVSHMGEITVRGAEAEAALNYLLSNDVSKLTPGRAQYTVLTTDAGTPVDDLIVYRIAQDSFLLCVNASNTEKDFNWIVKRNRHDVEIENVSDSFALIAVQGPKSKELCSRLLGRSLDALAPFSHELLSASLDGAPLEGRIARTGYTGENGYELYVSPEQAPLVWSALLRLGQDLGVLPIGLGARDSLRLEAALCLYGHELREDIDILSAGLGWVTKFQKGDFIGRDSLLRIQETGIPWKLIGLELLEPGIARENTVVADASGNEVGFVTSGTMTPTLQKAVALAYVRSSAVDNEIFTCVVRGKNLPAKRVPIPFYKRT